MILLFLLAQETAEGWLPRAGTVWTYEQNEAGAKKKTVMKALREEKGRTLLESKEYAAGSEEACKEETLAILAEEGCLVFATLDGERLTDQIRLYKLGSKKGDAWKSPLGEAALEGEMRHLGVEEIRVGAGSFKEAVHLRLRLADAIDLDFWIAPRVGLLRLESKTDGMEISMELTEYREPATKKIRK